MLYEDDKLFFVKFDCLCIFFFIKIKLVNMLRVGMEIIVVI